MKGKASSRRSRGGNPPDPLRYPSRLYDMGELALLMNVDPRFIKRVRDAGAPFPLGKTRPEWVLDWIRKNHRNLKGKLTA